MKRPSRLCRGSARAPTPPVARANATRTAIARAVPVALRWDLANGVLALTATTQRSAASYDDYWSVSPSLALATVTIADTPVAGARSYVSRATVAESLLACDTTYTFSYAIVMRTAASTWVGSSSVTVTVGPDGPAGSLSFP